MKNKILLGFKMDIISLIKKTPKMILKRNTIP